MKITEENVLDGIREMLSKSYPTVEITMDTYLEFGDSNYLDMTSIEIVEFIVALEKRYSIIIDIEDRYYTVGDAVRGVVAYLIKKEEEIQEGTSESEL